MLTKMETSTVNALIAACSAILVAWIGFQAKKYVDESVLPQKSIQMKTLLEVLVPLLNTLNVVNRYTWVEQEKELLHLLNDKQILIPTTLASQMQAVLLSDDSERDKALQALHDMVDAYANWYRKKLGYPYDDKKIDKRYTATTMRNEKIKGIISLVLDIAWFFCGLYTFFLGLYLNKNGTQTLLAWWSIIPMGVSIFGLPFALINVAKWSKE